MGFGFREPKTPNPEPGLNPEPGVLNLTTRFVANHPACMGSSVEGCPTTGVGCFLELTTEKADARKVKLHHITAWFALSCDTDPRIAT